MYLFWSCKVDGVSSSLSSSRLLRAPILVSTSAYTIDRHTGGEDHTYSVAVQYMTHWLQVIYKSLLGKAPPYLSSLVTIAAPTHSTRFSRYISLVTPKANSSFGRLSFQFSAANDWNKLQKSLKLETHISLTSLKHQLSEELIVHCTSISPTCN